jgi:two-component system sensor histidine kinase DesK
MSTAAESVTRLESALRWCHGPNARGAERSGHLVVILALIGLAAYGLFVAGTPLRYASNFPQLAIRLAASGGWLVWATGYAWSLTSLLRGRRRHRSTQAVAIASLAVSMLLFAELGPTFAAPPALTFSVMLLCLSGRVRGVVAVALLACYFTLTVLAHGDMLRDVEQFAMWSLIFYAIPRLVIFVADLEDTRSELARLAVSEQRLRWARDLHDTLGHGLSVALLKLELVERLNTKDPIRATVELNDARSLLRESIGEMQTVVAGMRDVSLAGEVGNARAILAAAGVHTRTEIAAVPLDPRVAETLAWIVREGTTNVLRHSDSSTCDIALRVDRGRALLTIANDGPSIHVTRSPSGGNGIRGMRERLHVLGGRLTTRSTTDDGFVLEATVPLPMASISAPRDPVRVDGVRS